MLARHGIPGSSPTALQRRKYRVSRDGSTPAEPERPDLYFSLGHLVGQVEQLIATAAEEEGVSKPFLTEKLCERLTARTRR